VIAHEVGAVNTIDPLGGSYYVEHLTSELERQAYEYFDRIEELGGVVPAIEENFFQREIAEASYRYQSEVEAKQRIIVGVNRYQLEDEQPLCLVAVAGPAQLDVVADDPDRHPGRAYGDRALRHLGACRRGCWHHSRRHARRRSRRLPLAAVGRGVRSLLRGDARRDRDDDRSR